MSLNESSATALVRFTGLGIVCFNDNPRRGEIAAIRDNKHTLTIKIQKPVFQEGSETDAIVYQDVATYANLPNEDVQLEIKATNPVIGGYEIYQSGDFDRLGAADVNDFRWFVNLHSLHGAADLAPTANHDYPLAKIYIGNGLFYAHKLDRNLFFEKVEKDAAGTATQKEAFGHVAETIGVKLEGDAVSVRVRIGSKDETHSLGRIEGLPYRIEIKNVDYSANAIYSDLPDYYRYLASPSGKKFDLTPIEDNAEEGEGISQRDFCHPIVLDDPISIDNL